MREEFAFLYLDNTLVFSDKFDVHLIQLIKLFSKTGRVRDENKS